jgi:hypothetical protein
MFRKLLGIDSEVKELRARLDRAESERDSLRVEKSQFAHEHQTRITTIARLETELRVTKEKLREQTDADLMLVCARIILATVNGKKPDPVDLAAQQRLALQQQSMNMYNYGGLFDGQYGGLAALMGLAR